MKKTTPDFPSKGTKSGVVVLVKLRNEILAYEAHPEQFLDLL